MYLTRISNADNACVEGSLSVSETMTLIMGCVALLSITLSVITMIMRSRN